MLQVYEFAPWPVNVINSPSQIVVSFINADTTGRGLTTNWTAVDVSWQAYKALWINTLYCPDWLTTKLFEIAPDTIWLFKYHWIELPAEPKTSKSVFSPSQSIVVSAEISAPAISAQVFNW